MAPEKLTEYERRRLENIKRNDQMLASLNIRFKINDLTASAKRQRAQTKVIPEKKSKPETPIATRRSLRRRGMPPPDTSTAGDLKKEDSDETLTKTPKLLTKRKKNPKLKPKLGPITMKDAYCGDATDQKLAETIIGVSKNSQLGNGDENESLGYPIRVSGCVDLGAVKLEPKNIARVVPGRILTVRFFPSMDMKLVAVGNKFGNIGFWNVDAKEEDGDGIYLYQPHSAPVSGIVVQPCSLSKVYSSCYDGFLRLMDVEKELFNVLYSSDDAIFSIAQRPNEVKSLYFAKGQGIVNMWDERAGKALTPWVLHEERINTIDFSTDNTNIMATSSSDGTACIWDLRFVDAVKPKLLKAVSHDRAVQSAYFSPSGSCLATTGFDDKVGLLTGANFEDLSMIHHNNQTGRWISSFRAIWGWDDSYLFIGTMNRAVTVISTARRSSIGILESPHVSAIPCRFDAHPYMIGMLAGATSGGQVYIWTTG
ncbi:hypothetical protein RHGRI_000405 [Rhododendron griersonianum]|uniref:WD repeat-containing protein 76 n=1 Tax=Rhododendron griersonianum TaxID=479676 RepID=A0AAV6LHK0_9ERIC|nr:hypothetical protein RHGRI_000405 [Rhododendron griersonianum]